MATTKSLSRHHHDYDCVTMYIAGRVLISDDRPTLSDDVLYVYSTEHLFIPIPRDRETGVFSFAAPLLESEHRHRYRQIVLKLVIGHGDHDHPLDDLWIHEPDRNAEGYAYLFEGIYVSAQVPCERPELVECRPAVHFPGQGAPPMLMPLSMSTTSSSSSTPYCPTCPHRRPIDTRSKGGGVLGRPPTFIAFARDRLPRPEEIRPLMDLGLEFGWGG